MAQRNLRVPLLSQPRGKPYCGAACAQMVLAYHGVHIPQPRIVRDLGLLKAAGVNEMKLAAYFTRLGFETKLVMWRSIFPMRFYRMPENELRAELLRWSQRRVNGPYRFRRSCQKLLEGYFGAGGRIETRPVTSSDIRSALRRGEPPIVSLNMAALWTLTKGMAAHYVVPVGIRQGNVSMRDPNRGHGGNKTYPLEDFMYACHRLSAAALFIKPKP